MTASASSKTFFLGEYGALKDSPSLILCTDPQFHLDFSKTVKSQGPILDFLGAYKEAPGEFLDPWEGAGGFGASSAEFALYYKKLHPDFVLEKESVENMLATYRKYYWNCEGLAPSGHDVIGQLMGLGLHFVDPKNGVFKTLKVALEGYDFVVHKTSNKIPTHAHLKQIQVVNFDLRRIVLQAKDGLENNNLLQVVAAIEEQNRLFIEERLVSTETLKIRKEIESEEGVVITKGCGALGADTILIVCEKEKSKTIQKKWAPTVLWEGKI